MSYRSTHLEFDFTAARVARRHDAGLSGKHRTGAGNLLALFALGASGPRQAVIYFETAAPPVLSDRCLRSLPGAWLSTVHAGSLFGVTRRLHTSRANGRRVA